MVGTKITHQRMENQIVSMKITRPRVRQHKNNSPERWMGGELNDCHENNSPKHRESNSKHENNSPEDGELNGRHENSSPNGWTAQK